jgi:hypothetical protein
MPTLPTSADLLFFRAVLCTDARRSGMPSTVRKWPRRSCTTCSLPLSVYLLLMVGNARMSVSKDTCQTCTMSLSSCPASAASLSLSLSLSLDRSLSFSLSGARARSLLSLPCYGPLLLRQLFAHACPHPHTCTLRPCTHKIETTRQPYRLPANDFLPE